MTRKELQKLSPVEIRYEPCPTIGRYCYWETPPYIRVDNNLVPIKKVIVALHEIGHAVHANCKCMQGTDIVLQEYHAHKFIIKHIKNDVKLIAQFKREITNFVNSKLEVIEYRVAAKQIMKLKSYAKLIN